MLIILRNIVRLCEYTNDYKGNMSALSPKLPFITSNISYYLSSAVDPEPSSNMAIQNHQYASRIVPEKA